MLERVAVVRGEERVRLVAVVRSLLLFEFFESFAQGEFGSLIGLSRGGEIGLLEKLVCSANWVR